MILHRSILICTKHKPGINQNEVNHSSVRNHIALLLTIISNPPGPPQQQPHQPHQQQGQDQDQGQLPTLINALSFLDQIKIQFADREHIYDTFLELMREFKRGDIDVPSVVGSVRKLFEEEDELLRGFDGFLPGGYRLQ